MHDKKSMDAIFKDMNCQEFIELLQQSTGNPDIEIKENVFRLKKAYPVINKAELKNHLL